MLPTHIPSASHRPQSGAPPHSASFSEHLHQPKEAKEKGTFFQTSLTKAKTDLKPAQLITGIKVSPPY